MWQKIIWGLIIFLLLIIALGIWLATDRTASNWVLFAPWSAFDADEVPPAPDYAQDNAWASLPSKQDDADQVPPETDTADRQASAMADVFFLHPTTYFSKNGWNAPLALTGFSADMLNKGVLRHQASIFNGCCRLYAPRYRQATLYAFQTDGPSGEKALELAYQDVVAAFDAFQARRGDPTRPFIIAGHSQGSLHGLRLLQERILGTPLEDRLIAAYLVGYSIPRALPGIAPCATAQSTGCVLAWNSVGRTFDGESWTVTNKLWLEGGWQKIEGHALACVNPLSGELDGSEPADANQGAVGYAEFTQPMQPPMPAYTEATCRSQDHLLLVDPDPDMPRIGSAMIGDDYHVYDYGLFYMNIREDAERRTGAWFGEAETREASSDAVHP